MRALITGITGFVGSHLAEYLLGMSVEVFGTVRWRSRRENIAHIGNRINLVECDMCDASSVLQALRTARPDIIFHLAAQSFVPTSWHAPAETMSTNTIGQLNLFEAVRRLELDCRIQIAGSSEEYGMVLPNETPISEENPLRPLSPYGVSKVAQDLLGYQYHQSYGLHIVRTRAFNHTGPRRGEVFVTSNFAKQIACIEKGDREPVIDVGNLDALRDFLDVRDVCRAYWDAVMHGDAGEVYNICSGTAWSIRAVLECLLGFSTKSPEIRTDPDRLRPSDVPILLGDCDNFRKCTGWRPEIRLEQTLGDLLNYWRERV